MKNRRTFVLAPLGAVAVVLAFASLAYACTTIVGSITTTPASGSSVSVGQSITATGTDLNVRRNPNTGSGSLDPNAGPGAPDGTLWGLYFLRYKSNDDSMDSCMGDLVAGEQKMGQESKQQVNNSVTITGPIPGPRTVEPPPDPLAPQPDNARVCFISEGKDRLTGETQANYRYGTPSSEFVIVGGS